MRFSERLKELRTKKGYSQHKLAKESGVPQTSINFYESDKRQPTVDVLIKLCKYFNVSSDYLIGLVDEPFGDISPELKKRLTKLETLESENYSLKEKIQKAIKELY